MDWPLACIIITALVCLTAILVTATIAPPNRGK